MKIIDAHIHFSNIKSFVDTAKVVSLVDYSYKGYCKSFSRNEVVASIGMGLQELKENSFPDSQCCNPMLLDLHHQLPQNMFCCLGINPAKLCGEQKNMELRNIEQHVKDDFTVGLKIYAGYYHCHVYDAVYEPVYALAAKYQLPVVIHSGNTYSERGLLKYSHPLNVDELAVKHREVDFIIAHLGCPWTLDCAEVISKNCNVYADLSGLIVGNYQIVKKEAEKKLFVELVQRALVYTDNYEKFLFGSDWPLVDLGAYIDFIKNIVPQKHHKDVFYNNAKRLFKIETQTMNSHN